MSRNRIVLLLVLGVIVATTLALALYAPTQAMGYGEIGTASGTPSTGAEGFIFLALAGAGMIAAGYLVVRKSKA